MTTDESIMAEMIDRVVSREGSDELSIQIFVGIVRSNSNLVAKAQEMIVSKIRSPNVSESTRAIELLEECMSKCGSDFQDEASKFRFLNELIRLVSRKYEGGTTPVAIKKRILECLLLWTTEFPNKAKIREAYDMLNKEGSLEHGNSAAAIARRENVLGIDEEKLSKLLKSNDPENLKRANLLIKYKVNQDNRQMELMVQHKSTLAEISNTANLLNEMLATYEKDGRLCVDGSDTMNLMRELYMECKKHKVIMQRLPDLIQSVDEGGLLAETLQTNDVLQGVMKRYKDVVVHSVNSKPTPPTAATPTATGQTDLLSELLGITTTTSASIPKVPNSTTNASPGTTLDDLKEIFGNIETEKQPEMEFSGNLFGESSVDILQPVSVFSSDVDSNKTSPMGDTTPENPTEKNAFRELREIDKLSEELFKQNMQTKERIVSFKKREPVKMTLNDLLKEKPQPKEGEKETSVEKSKEPCSAFNTEDDEILSDKGEVRVEAEQKSEKEGRKSERPPLHLSEIEIDLDELTPCFGNERTLLDDEDIKITMTFTKDRPSKQVSVLVLSVSNKSKLALKNFQFEASVKKPSKVRLLPATESALPPFKPYRPPTPINQVLLLLNPTGKDVDVTCIFGYSLGDDPDPIKESIVVKGISYVE